MRAPLFAFVLACAVLLSGCASLPEDDDANAAAARTLTLDQWHRDTLHCHDREGDCSDWSRLTVERAGELRVEVLLDPAEPLPDVTLSLVDEEGLTVLETRSDGRDQLGVKLDAPPGPLLLWLRPTRPGEHRFGYRVRAELSATPTLPPPPPAPVRKPAGPPPTTRDACVQISANPELNFYDGQAHAVLLSFYPLRSAGGFESASVSDLIGGAMPPGVAGAKLRVTITPGERRTLREVVPRAVRSLGIVADFYRSSTDPAGSRRVVVPVSCGADTPGVTLTRSDLLVNSR